MWIFNVSGFDAVEIKMKNGKIYRIGTDEPNQLECAILDSANLKIYKEPERFLKIISKAVLTWVHFM